MQIATLDGLVLLHIAFGSTSVCLSLDERRRAMHLLRELRSLGFPIDMKVAGVNENGLESSCSRTNAA